jgi:predicted transcriptional regulator
MSDKTTLTIRIERDLLKDMKIIAIQQDTSVTRIIIDYLEQYVEEHKK